MFDSRTPSSYHRRTQFFFINNKTNCNDRLQQFVYFSVKIPIDTAGHWVFMTLALSQLQISIHFDLALFLLYQTLTQSVVFFEILIL